jgi:putative ABC transport system substrate-binding protein
MPVRVTDRRTFITALGGAVAWPMVARAHQAGLVIGYLNAGSKGDAIEAPFIKGLQEAGYVEGQNLTIERRFADFRNERLPELAADLVRRRVSVIAAIGAPNAPLAAKRATATIPIVFSTGGDPVALGLVAGINRPGGKITGTTFLNNLLGSKRLDLLRDLVPAAMTIGFLNDPNNPNNAPEVKNTEDAANALGRKLILAPASTSAEIDAAFAALKEARAEALIVAAEAFFMTRRDQLVALTQRYALPAMYGRREYVEAGGLMSYGINPTQGRESGRSAGARTGEV